MAMNPSHHLCPTTATTMMAKNFLDSFQSSFFGFHGAIPCRFVRYSSTSLRSYNGIASGPAKDQNQLRKCDYSSANKVISLSADSCTDSNGDWLENWNRTRKHNQPKPPRVVVNYRKDKNFSGLGLGNGDNSGGTRGGGGGGGSSTMEKIVEKLKKFGYMDENDRIENKQTEQERRIKKGSVEDILNVEEGMLPNTRGGISKDSPLGVENIFGSNGEVMFPWEKVNSKQKKEEGDGVWTARKESRYSIAEMTLPESEVRRLRDLTFQTKSKMKIRSAGVTQAAVDAIHEKWKSSEIVRLKIEGACALNMRRMHEILERKTGGLVIWRSGTSVSLYRGVGYEVPSVKLNKGIYKRDESSPSSLLTSIVDHTNKQVHLPRQKTEATDMEMTAEISQPELDYEDEIDKLLEGLGPRYMDWQGCNPLPVDADLLPGIIPGYEPPFRVLPFGVRSTLGQKDATALRRLARVLPPHFALGRSRQLQGLATAMTKLWEKSSIAKIALKRGVQLTTSERMAEELKRLTGGMLLSRNKDFLVFYRGKDFLSQEVAEALLEKERLAKSLQDEEEQARLRASSALVAPATESIQEPVAAGTLSETLDATGRWGKDLDDDDHVEEVKREAEKLRHVNLVRKLERKLAFAERKLLKAERDLSKVEEYLNPAEHRAHPESITDEERFMFRKLGLKMKAFLLLGRRGVFDGTVENMHLHWKYRELVKILMKAKSFEHVKKVALALEAESGGILVSIDKVSKGYAIIVYRGKDYKRPSSLRPRNLLTKRKALARSIELQRREAVIKHISTVQTRVEKLRAELKHMDLVEDNGDEDFYNKLHAAYPSADEETETEEEGDDAYLETYKSENDDKEEEDEGGGFYQGLRSKTDHPSHHEQWELDEAEAEFGDDDGDASAAAVTNYHTSIEPTKDVDGEKVHQN